ncbi:hypothetical protein K7432_018185 [Basidiobolus ranarum]|uniref:Uncharacterized protein n=1 Tax=Basidiobolus ranarum TaxID=34480 RepID=A0ABR2WCH6_9FUNG
MITLRGLCEDDHDVDQELLLHEVVQAPPAFTDGNVVGEPVTSLDGRHGDGVGMPFDPVADMSALLGADEPMSVQEATIGVGPEEVED